MKNHLTNNTAERRASTLQLECKVVVEARNIDFLSDQSIFIAGSATNDCGAISPLPDTPRAKRRVLRTSAP